MAVEIDSRTLKSAFKKELSGLNSKLDAIDISLTKKNGKSFFVHVHSHQPNLTKL